MEIAFEQTNLLIDRGASCTAKNKRKETCLHLVLGGTPAHPTTLSTYRPHKVLVKLLARIVQAGGDVFAVNDHGESPSELAANNGNEKDWREALSLCGVTTRHAKCTRSQEYNIKKLEMLVLRTI